MSKTITKDQDGKSLTNAKCVWTYGNQFALQTLVCRLNRGAPRTWNDAMYAEDPSTGSRYVFVNEGDVYDAGTANPYSWVSVIDVDKKEVFEAVMHALCFGIRTCAAPQFVQRIKVRPNPVHSYSIPPLGEIWVHSDANATFDVISVRNLSLAAQPVPVCQALGLSNTTIHILHTLGPSSGGRPRQAAVGPVPAAPGLCHQCG